MKKAILCAWVWLLFLTAAAPASDEALRRVIQEKKWGELPALFSDASWEKLAAGFAQAQAVKLTPFSKSEILYKAKFAQYAEIGFLVFQKEGEKYRELSLENQIKPIYFITGFRRYEITREVSLRLGEAELLLRRGTVYEALPRYRTGFLFVSGDWQFKIKPGDEEERLTLLRHLKSDTFVKETAAGVFILQDRNFLYQLAAAGESETIADPALASGIGFFQDYFGFREADFNEIWYLSVQDSENVAIFERDRRSLYFYDFNPASVPDTQLRTTPDNRLLLNYNGVTGPKLQIAAQDELTKVSLSLFYNPEKSFLSGTATLQFKNKLTFRMLNLYRELLIRQAVTDDLKSVNLFKKGDIYFASSPQTDSLSFFYSGAIRGDEDIPDLVQVISEGGMEKRVDPFHFLSRHIGFYPMSGSGFFRSGMKISLPEKYACLGSGGQVGFKKEHGRRQYHIASEHTKGIALIAGEFEKRATLPGFPPVHVHAADDFRYKRHYGHETLRECVDFVGRLYGDYEVPALNILVRRWRTDGGISNSGFIILNVLEPHSNLADYSVHARYLQRESPVVLSSDKSEYLVHELAHQFWGQRVSWSGYQDEWITEGLAHFTTLLYLRERSSESRFAGLTERMLRWVLRHGDAGPVIYGKRIANLDVYEAFQSLIYVKSALVFVMLRDMIGQDELMRRLRSVLATYKYRNVTSRDFINLLSEGSPLILRFLSDWIYSRKVPEVSCQVTAGREEAEVLVTQEGAGFVFPLWIQVEGEPDARLEIIDAKEKRIKVRTAAPARGVRVDSRYVPILLKRVGAG